MEKIRVVIVGFGVMGRNYAHMICSGLVPEMELAGVCCRNEAGQQWLKEKFPGVALYVDVEDALAHQDAYDAAMIVTPHKTHVPIATRFVQAGKPILLEKPASVYAGEVQKLYDLAKEKNIPFAMMFNNRQLPAFRKAKQMLENGELGTLHRAVWVCNDWYRSPAYHRSGSWRSSWTGEGGGLMINQNVHFVDLWRWLFGMPQSLYADMQFGRYNDFLVDDAVDIQMSYGNGFHGTMISATGEAPGVNRLEIWGSEGRLTVTDGRRIALERNEVSTEEFGRTVTDPNQDIGHYSQAVELEEAAGWAPWANTLANFAAHLLRGEKLCATGEDGLKTAQLTNGIYLSGWKQSKVTLPVDNDAFVQEFTYRQGLEKNKN